MKNLIEKLNGKFSKEIQTFGITEVFILKKKPFIRITSEQKLPIDLEHKIGNEAFNVTQSELMEKYNKLKEQQG